MIHTKNQQIINYSYSSNLSPKGELILKMIVLLWFLVRQVCNKTSKCRDSIRFTIYCLEQLNFYATLDFSWFPSNSVRLFFSNLNERFEKPFDWMKCKLFSLMPIRGLFCCCCCYWENNFSYWWQDFPLYLMLRVLNYLLLTTN